MKPFIGYTLTAIGLLDICFFLNYNGSAIQLKEFWFVLGIFILLAGSYLIAKHKLQQLNNQYTDSNETRFKQIEQLKRSGEKIRVTLENAEVKNRTYQEEIIEEEGSSQIKMIDELYYGNRSPETKQVQQSYIVFYKEYNGKQYKFISQASRQDIYALRTYLDNEKGIDLYIDPNDPTNYYYDLRLL